jgi:aerobic carbon-monoxide dehydrogenase large subunit
VRIRWATGHHYKTLPRRLSTSQGFDEIVDAELGLDNDGHVRALAAEVIGDVGAYSIYPWTAAALEPVQVVSFMPGPYRVPTYRGHVRAVATCKAPTGPYRGVGRPISTFVMERPIDIAAHHLAIHPVELRLRNLIAVDEFPWDRSGFAEALTIACAAIDYPAELDPNSPVFTKPGQLQSSGLGARLGDAM